MSEPENKNNLIDNSITLVGNPKLQQHRSNDSQMARPPKNPANNSAGPSPEQRQAINSMRNSPLAEKVMEVMTAKLSSATSDDIVGEIFCLQAMFPAYAGKPKLDPLMVYKATTDPDTMYLLEIKNLDLTTNGRTANCRLQRLNDG